MITCFIGERSDAVLRTTMAGTVGGRHNHPGGEELFVLDGDCDVNGVRPGAGDYLYTPPVQGHRLLAHSDTTVLVCLPQLTIPERSAET